MYAYGTFYDRIGEERIKIKLDDAELKPLVKARKADDDTFDDLWDEYEKKHNDSIRMFVTLTGLRIQLEEEGKVTGTFVSDEEEWLIAYGSNEAKVKKAYAKAADQHGIEEDDWEE